ncbi:MAG: lamin tail domain-containing protein, partial [Anaerolineae bacterium]|nr:lamin tail domain-containing protein [Anaerolineae bacterium]
AAGLHFFALTDHAWWMSQSEWTKTLTQTKAATVPDEFIALHGLEWTHDTVGHINLFNTETLVSHTNPLFADLSGLYTWLAANPHVIAQFNHPDPSYGGTFADFAYHPAAAQIVSLQEIGNNAQRYTTYEASFVQSNAVGWRTAPANNSDHHASAWGSDNPARTGIIAPDLTTESVLDALRRRRVFATEDSNLAVALRVGADWMGSTLNRVGIIPLTIEAVDQDAEAATLFLYDRNLLVATHHLSSNGQWQISIEARPGHYFWVKVIQADGDTAYSAPIWIAGQAAPETVYINEVLPSPGDVDWDGDGSGDYQDEWVELYNPTNRAIGLGGWRLSDSSKATFNMPLSFRIPPRGYLTIYNSQMGFALNNSADTVTLTRLDGSIADTFSYTSSPGYDGSWCRVEDGSDEWSDDCIASPDGANWQQGPAQPLKVHVYEAKKLAYDAWVRVTGRVTAPPGILGPRSMYIQDDSAGILVYLPKSHALQLNLGDKVTVEGNLRQFGSEFEIVVRHRSKVKFIEAGSPPPPLPVATTMMLEPFEGRLVMLRGQAVRFKGVTTFWVDDGTDPAKVYIRSTTGIKKPFIEPGTMVTIVGIVSQYSDPDNPTRYDYRLLPRFQADLGFPSPIEPAEPATERTSDKRPSLLPETGSR